MVLAHSPSLQVNAQEKPAAAKPSQSTAKSTPQASSAIDPQKETRIRELMEVTGAKNLGQQLIEAGMEQFRSSVQAADDLQGLLDYYHSALGQRMLKALPEVTRESQAACLALGQKAAQETMEELKTDFPEFTGANEEDKHPGGEPNQN